MDRRLLGAWLAGPTSTEDDPGHPGEQMGRPASGPSSIASIGPRAAAFVLDSVMSLAVASLFFRPLESWTTTAVFLAEVLVLGVLGGASAGQRIAGMRFVRVDGTGAASPLQVAIRTALLALVLPALVVDRDGRGLHDRAAGTVLERTR